MKRDLRVMDDATHLQLHLETETEMFLCADNRSFDSEWNLYQLEEDGTSKKVTYVVTEEQPPDRSVILQRWDNGDRYRVRWSVSVEKVDSRDEGE